MKKNKEIKKGDSIWLCSACLGKQYGYKVLNVKKAGTLVTVTIECEYFNNSIYEVTLYGHASSSVLSGYDRKFGDQDIYYVCDFDIIEKLTSKYYRDEKYIEAGRALLNLAKYLK